MKHIKHHIIEQLKHFDKMAEQGEHIDISAINDIHHLCEALYYIEEACEIIEKHPSHTAAHNPTMNPEKKY